jgi:L-amino acid N-acyltransferase YncA
MSRTIRMATLDDAAAVQAIYAPYCDQSPVSFEIVAPTVPQMRERMAGVLARFPWLVGEVDGVVAGYVYASPSRERAAYQWGVDVAIYIGANHRRAGLGCALYTALFDLLRAQGFFHAYAGITIPNAASVALHERFGFSLVGAFKNVGYKNGAWRDVGWFHLPLQPLIDNPSAPRPWSDLPPEAIVAALEHGQQTSRA